MFDPSCVSPDGEAPPRGCSLLSGVLPLYQLFRERRSSCPEVGPECPDEKSRCQRRFMDDPCQAALKARFAEAEKRLLIKMICMNHP